MMEIVSLTGTQDIVSGGDQFSMVVRARGEDYSIPIGFDTYQLLNELASLVKGAPPMMVEAPATQPVFEAPQPPKPEWEEPSPPAEPNSPLEQLAKVGLFEPQNVLDAVNKPNPDVDELMGVLEDTSDEEEEDDPGELNIDDSVEQYTGS